jgi:predicted permease
MLAGLWNDVRYSARVLARNPGFAAAAIVTIALGVGVNTGIFTVLNGVLFRSLPVPDARELVTIRQQIEGVPDREGATALGLFSTAEYRIYAERSKTLSGVFGTSDPTRTTLGGDSPQQVMGTIVTCGYFEVLRQPPEIGRGLTAQDCETGADPVVVLSHDLWARTFGADPGAVGRTVELNRRLFTVVGVARKGTYSGFGIYRTAYFAPISTQPLLLPNEDTYTNDRSSWLFLFGRRKASLEQVRAELAVIAAQIDRQEPGRTTAVSVERATLLGPLGFVRTMALAAGAVVMTAFALVLLIACANVANLLLARATVRGREIALRLSLGASRARLIRQLLIESVLIAAAGGALGSVLALWSFQLLIALALPSLTPVGVPPLVLDASPDVHVLIFTLLLASGTGILFGLAPALHVSRPDLHTVMKHASSDPRRRGGRLQGMLVGAQVAMCLVLMIAAGLLLRGLSATQAIDPGFDYRDVVVASYDLTSAGYDPERAAVFQRRLLDEVDALPGVQGAAQAALEPLRADSESAAIRLPGRDRSGFRRVELNVVTPDYFDLLGLPIERGRTFNDAEPTGTPVAVIVTQTTARNLWPNQDPIGRTLSMAVADREVELNVIGVAKDAQVTGIGRVEPYYLYLPASARTATLLRLLVKSRTDFASTAAAIRGAVQTLDPGVAVDVNPLRANLDYWRNLSGALSALAATLGVLALVLASVGIYGVVAYFIGRRTREIGIRIALGAGTGDVLGHVLGRTMRPIVVGASIGLVAAIGVSRVLSSVLFGVSPLDPIGIGAATLLVLGVALAAGVLPGRRAARTQPVAALREE